MNLRTRFSFILGVTVLSSFSAWAAPQPSYMTGRPYSARTGAEVLLTDFANDLGKTTILVLGEKHNTTPVQQAQADVYQLALAARVNPSDSTLAWEFLNWKDQSKIDAFWFDVILDKRSPNDFLNQFLGGPGKYYAYAPIFQHAREQKARVLGTNLSREDKAPILEKGIAGLDPKLLPAGFEYGSAAYHERFETVLREAKPNLTPDELARFYDAQCVTDEVIADQVARDVAPFKTLIEGAFHTDYFGGTVERLMHRASGQMIRVVRFVDLADYSSWAEVAEVVQHPKYGPVADYVWFVNSLGQSEKSR